MWAVGAVGVLEERKACGRWVWWGRCCGVGGDYKSLDSLCFGAEEGMSAEVAGIAGRRARWCVEGVGGCGGGGGGGGGIGGGEGGVK